MNFALKLLFVVHRDDGLSLFFYSLYKISCLFKHRHKTLIPSSIVEGFAEMSYVTFSLEVTVGVILISSRSMNIRFYDHFEFSKFAMPTG